MVGFLLEYHRLVAFEGFAGCFPHGRLEADGDLRGP